MIVNGDVPAPECIVLVPQHPGREEDYWDICLDSVVACVDKVIEDYEVDRSRIALTGFSNGGIGMWDLVAAKPGIYSRLLCIEGKVNRKSQHPELFEGCQVHSTVMLSAIFSWRIPPTGKRRKSSTRMKRFRNGSGSSAPW